MHLTGVISNISRGSFHDGSGLRTVIYFKGCGLRCRWCHNPETFTQGRNIMYIPAKCIHCGRCAEVCPRHQIVGNDMLFLREGCSACGKCAQVCPTGALVVCGEEMTVEGVMNEIRKDAHYYAVSGGGVTLSGGECLLQPDFVASILQCCKAEGIHTVIETALFVPWENIQKIIPYTDMFFADFKIPDSQKHRAYTGQGNELILENLRRLSSLHPNITLRIPLIPGVNDSMEDMNAFGRIIKTIKIEKIELLRYNYMAESKYQVIGLEYESFGSESQSDSYMKQLQEILQKQLPEKKVFYI